jgi:hypothetical protein
VCADVHGSQDLRPGADVHMTVNDGSAAAGNCPNGHLLKYQAIHAYSGVRMNYDPIGMRYQQTATYPRVEWYVGAGYDAPKAMPKSQNFPAMRCYYPGPSMPILIPPDRQQEFSGRIPKLSRMLSTPIRNFGADHLIVHSDS